MKTLAAALLIATAVPVMAQAPTYKLDAASNKQYLADNAKKHGVVVLPDGLQYRVIKSGTGQKVQSPMDKIRAASNKFVEACKFFRILKRAPI